MLGDTRLIELKCSLNASYPLQDGPTLALIRVLVKGEIPSDYG